MNCQIEVRPGGPGRQEALAFQPEIRFADPEIDGQVVADLYIEPSTIEHLADVKPDGEYISPTTREKETVTPESRLRQLKEYYKTHPNAALIVVTLPGQGIVGAATIVKEESLRSAKLSRLVVKEGFRNHGLANRLLRSALTYAFSSEKTGGLACEQVQLGVIQDVEGSGRAVKAFEKVGFDFFGTRLYHRCDSWSNSKKRMVPRDVRQMMLQKGNYRLKKNPPRPAPHSEAN